MSYSTFYTVRLTMCGPKFPNVNQVMMMMIIIIIIQLIYY